MTDLVQKLTEKAKANPLGPMLVRFNLAPEGDLFLDTRSGEVDVKTSCTDEPRTTMTLTSDDFRQMLDGVLNPTKAFMGGKMQIDGDMALAMKLANVFA